MKNRIYLLKLRLITSHYCRKYRIKKTKGLIIEHGFKVYDDTKVTIGEGSHICKNVVFSGGGTIVIGKKTTIFRDCEIHSYTGSKITIGNDCLVSKDNYIINANHSFSRGELIRKQPPTFEDMIIGNDVWIGGGCKIIKGAKIGDGSIIGAGSVVNKEIPDLVVAAGAPCKPIKKR